MNMHKTLAILLSAFLIACGGGGGGGGNNNGGNNPSPTLQQEVQDILDGCVGDAASALQALIAVAQLGQGGSDATLTLEPLAGLQIPFQADLDGDMAPDALGRIGFFDAGGNPIQPQDPGGDVNQLLAQILALPDNSRVDIVLDPVVELGINSALLSQTIVGGSAGVLSGVIEHQNGECTTTLQFADESLLGILGTYPNLDTNLTVVATPDNLAGTIAFNGTKDAVIDVTLNGVGPVRFLLDLDTGELTPAS